MRQLHVVQQVEFIKEQIRAGIEPAKVRELYMQKWPNTTTRQIERRTREATAAIREEQRYITEEAAAVLHLNLESRARHILSVVERKEILTQIALGQLTITKPINVGGKVEYVQCEPDYTDRRLAIAELNKIDGSYQPIRADITTNGQSITPVTTTVIQFNGVDIPLLQ